MDTNTLITCWSISGRRAIRSLALVPFLLLIVASVSAPTSASDANLVPQLERMRAEIVQLHARVDQMERRLGQDGPEYRYGSTTARLVELRTIYGSVVIDQNGVAIQADKIRINGKTISIDASRTLDLSGTAVLVRGENVDVKPTKDVVLKGSKIIGEN